MRKNRFTRILALVMTICMVMGMFAGTVSAAETAAVSVTATSAVEVSTGGHYPVEFVLSNPTATDYSVTLSKSAGDAELTYQGTSAENGTIALSAYTEQTVSGYLTFTDSSAKAAADVTVKVLSGAKVLDTATISVNAVEAGGGYKAASWNFDDGIHGWINAEYDADKGAMKLPERSEIYPGDDFKLVSGHVYKLTFRAMDNVGEPGAFFARIRDYDKNGNELSTPRSLNQLNILSAQWQKFEYRFVANSTGDENYAYSRLCFDGEATEQAYVDYRRGTNWIDDVVLVDCGPVDGNLITNGDFEEMNSAGFGTVGNGFPNWVTANTESQGTTTGDWYNQMYTAYAGAEMMHITRDPAGWKYTEETYTIGEEVTISAWGRMYPARNFGEPALKLCVLEYANEEAVPVEKVFSSVMATRDWVSVSANYKKPDNVAFFRIGLDFENTEIKGTYVDHVTMYKTGAASAVTDADIAAAAPIEGVQTAVPEMSAPAVTTLVTTQEQLQAAQAAGGSTKLIADVTISGTQDMTGVELNGHKLNLTETASVTGVTKADVVAPKGYEVVVSGSTITVKKAQASSGTFTDNGRSLELEGIVYINHYTKITGFSSTEYIEANGGLLIWKKAVTEETATFENAEDVNPGLVYDSKYGEYLARTDGIPTKEFADQLYLRTYVQAADGTYHYGDLMPYSVKEYCEGRIANSTSAKMKALAAAMLHYGASAQNYFGYNLKNLANADITVPAETFDASLLNTLIPYTSAPKHSADVADNGKALTLVGAILIDFYFKAPDADYISAKLQVWDDTDTLTDANISYENDLEYDSKNKEWHGQSNGIFAKYYGKTIYARAKLTDSEGMDHYSPIVSYSVEEYAKGRIEKSTNAKMVELAKNLVIYGERARDYFGVTEETVYIPVDPSAGSEYVVQNNQPKAHIMLTEDATDLEKYAAEELQLHAEMVTGATLPITELDPAEDAFTAVAEPSVVYADKNGYYPVQFILKNPTATAMALTLRQKADTETEPVLTIRGDNGNDGVVYLDPYSQLAVSGQFKVEDVYAYPHSEVEVEIVQNGSVIETVTIDFAALASAVNGTFEDGKTGWVSGSAVTSAAHSGSGSLRVARNAEAATENVKLINGHRYYLSFYAKTNASGATVDVKINDYNASGAALRTPMSFSRSGIKLTSGEWTRYECSFLANTSGDESYAYSVLSLMNNATAGTNFDDIQLIDCGEMPEEVIPNGELENFENGKPTNWWTSNAAWEDKTTYYTGNKSAKISPTYGLGYGGFSGMEPNTTYAVSFWAKSVNAGTTVTFSANPWVAHESCGTTATETFDLTTGWERYEFVYKTPAVAEGVLYHGTYLNFGGAGTSYWLDHVRVHDIDEAVALEAELDKGTASGGAMPAEPAIPAPVNNDLTIVIATSDSYPELKNLFGDDLAWIGDTDGFAIRQLRGTIYIFGTEPRGALNGVYDFIEDNFGVIWFRANDTAYTAKASVKVKVEYKEKSPFAIRSWHMGGTGKNGEQMDDWDTDVMLSRNRFNARNGTLQNGPSWKNWATIGIKPFANDHNLAVLVTGSPVYDPYDVEYWNTDENGKYLTVEGGATDPIKYNINFYSQKTVDAVVAKALQDLKNDPGREYYAIGLHDTSYMVNKPYSDQAFEYAPGKLVYPSASNYKSTVFFTWLNKIAVRVAEQYPDVKIVTMAYSLAQNPPACGVEDNIQIIFCPIRENYKERLDTTDTSDANYAIYQDLLGWMSKTSNIVVYSYYGYAYPGAADIYMRPIAGKIQSDLQYYAEHGFGGVNPEGGIDYNSNPWAMNNLTYWLFHKLAWDPYADINALTEQFCDTVYGPASQYMQTYYDLLQQAWDNSSVDYNIDMQPKDYINSYIISAGVTHAKAMRTALNNAYNTAPAGSVYRNRIAYIKDAFNSGVKTYAPWNWFW